MTRIALLGGQQIVVGSPSEDEQERAVDALVKSLRDAPVRG